MKLYNVIATRIDDSSQKRIIAENKDLENAEAILKMVVMRRGVDEEFFSVVEVK